MDATNPKPTLMALGMLLCLTGNFEEPFHVVIGVGTCRCDASATLVRSHVRKPKDHTSGVELASTNCPFLRQTPFGAHFGISEVFVRKI